MKYFIPLFAILFISCNGGGNDNAPVSTDSLAIEKQMKDAIKAYPDSMLLKEKLIKYYEDNGEYDVAIAFTNELLKKDSNNVRLWEAKATLHFDDYDTTSSIFSLEKAIALRPDAQDLLNLGAMYAETKNPKALGIANALLTVKNGSKAKDAYFTKALYYNYTGNKARAISNADSCLAIDYNYMMAYREKAIALYDLGKYEAALAVLDKALSVQNNFDEGYYWRGRCLEKLNRKDDAIESYRTAILYNTDYVDAKQALERLEGKDN